MTDIISLAAAANKCKLVWTIAGATTAPTDFTKSDGYNVKSTCARIASTAGTDGDNYVQGWCVETLDTAGSALTTTTSENMGNAGICYIQTLKQVATGNMDVPDEIAGSVW